MRAGTTHDGIPMTAPAMFRGSVPGTQTRDGCSVALYEQLPYIDELEDSGLVLKPESLVLEPGCGTGRLTHKLPASGTEVTTVDHSDAMLQSVPDAAVKATADIESSGPRKAFADLPVGGSFLLQRQDPEWLCDAEVGNSRTMGEVTIDVEAVSRAMSRITMTLRDELERDVWRRSFTVVLLSGPEIESLLPAAGFESFRGRGRKRCWLHATAAAAAGAVR